MYPESVLTAGDGSPVNADGKINAASWDAYEATIMVGPRETAAQSGEWGDAITGARGAAMNVLSQVRGNGKNTSSMMVKSQLSYPPEKLHVPKNNGWKTIFLLKWPFFRGHISFAGFRCGFLMGQLASILFFGDIWDWDLHWRKNLRPFPLRDFEMTHLVGASKTRLGRTTAIGSLAFLKGDHNVAGTHDHDIPVCAIVASHNVNYTSFFSIFSADLK